MSRIGLDIRLADYRGGIPEYVRQLARRMPSLDGERLHVHLRSGAGGPLHPAARSVRSWTPPHHAFERSALALELFPHRLDLFHSPDFIPPRRGRYQRVITVQDLAFLTEGEVVPEEARRYYGRWIRTAVAEADAILAISQATATALVDALGVSKARIRVTHLGRDERMRPRALAELEPALGSFRLEPGYLLSVASFEWRKRHDLLVESYRRVSAGRRDVPPLVLVGHGGPTLPLVRSRIARLGLGERVRVLADVSAEALPTLYAGASLFALLSRDEGFALPLVDAMASGLPSIVSRRGALPEVAAGSALEMESTAPEEVADAILRLLEDGDLRTRLGEAALARSRLFDWEATARATLSVYDELLGTRRP